MVSVLPTQTQYKKKHFLIILFFLIETYTYLSIQTLPQRCLTLTNVAVVALYHSKKVKCLLCFLVCFLYTPTFMDSFQR